MELCRVATARSVWLFDVADLNPRGRRVEPVFESLKTRYHFSETAPDEKKSGLIFRNGTFAVHKSEIVIDTLEVYTDGIVVNTHSDTQDSDAVLDDALAWLWDEFGLGGKDFSKRVRRLYVSELIISCPGARIDRGMGALLTIIDSIAAIAGIERNQIETQAVMFGSSERRNLFTFERRVNEPYSADKYFSSASMHTADHLKLLQSVVDLLSSDRTA